LPFHAYINNAEIVTPGGSGKILGGGGAEQFDLGNNYDPQSATYTCHEGVFHFNARISTIVSSIDSEPHILNLIIEVVDVDNTTIKSSYESVLIVPTFVKSNTKLTTAVNTIIQVQDNEKVRVRVKHDRLVNMNIKLEEFSGSRQ
jgi:hypothetical protein